jgi:hypothetical protein
VDLGLGGVGKLLFARGIRSLPGLDKQLQQVANLGFRNRWKRFVFDSGHAEALSGNKSGWRQVVGVQEY